MRTNELVSWTQHVRGHGISRLFLTAAVILVAACQTAWAQQPASNASQPLRQEPQDTVGTANAVSTSETGPASDTPVVPLDCASCPSTATDVLAQRIDELAKAVNSSASAAKPSPSDPWQDAKAVLLNILSNRLDAWIFGGDGKGSVGFAALIVAILAFIIAIIELILAVATLNPAKPIGRWGKFKAWLRQSFVVRCISVVIAALTMVYAGAALYVVWTARSTPNVTKDSINALEKSLKTCQANLASISMQRQPNTQLPPTATLLPVVEALDKVGKSCDAAIRATDVRIDRVQKTASAIEGKQPWTTTKVFTFLTAVYLIAAITYLVFCCYESRSNSQ